MNFKGVEKFFLKLLFTGQSFKVSFRNVLGLLVVPPTLFQVAFGHRASWGPFGLWPGWAFSTCRMLLCLGVFDDAFLVGFVLVGVFCFLLQGDMYGPSLYPVGSILGVRLF